MDGWQGPKYTSGLLWKYRNTYSDHVQTKIVSNNGHGYDHAYSVFAVQLLEGKTKTLVQILVKKLL